MRVRGLNGTSGPGRWLGEYARPPPSALARWIYPLPGVGAVVNSVPQAGAPETEARFWNPNCTTMLWALVPQMAPDPGDAWVPKIRCMGGILVPVRPFRYSQGTTTNRLRPQRLLA